jgi:hypothetical protein
VITQLWRLEQLEYAWPRSPLQQYEDFWEVTCASLELACERPGSSPMKTFVDP